MKRDKLDRCRNQKTAVLTLHADIPFWCTLSPRERSRMRPNELQQYFIGNGAKRRALRQFIRSLAK